MRPGRWDYETLACGLRGHVTPAASVRTLRPEDDRFGFDVTPGRRLARCVRCDAWVEVTVEEPELEHLPEPGHLPRPRRGAELQDALVLRLIAVVRGLHSLAFGLLTVGLILVKTNLHRITDVGNRLAEAMADAVDHTGQQASRSFVVDTLHDVANLREHQVMILLVTAAAYTVLEAIEAIGLWHERRWAEYLTVAATAGFLPFEINALFDEVTVPRLGALALNVAILVWLVWSKRLFGLRGGAAALAAASRADIDVPRPRRV